MATNTLLAFPPFNVQFADSQGYITPAWSMWFQQLYERVGGVNPVPASAQTVTLAQKYAPSSYIDSNQNVISLYLVPTGYSIIIDSFSVTNTSAQAALLNVYVVSAGEIPSSSNLSISAQSIAPGGTVSISGLINKVIGGSGYVVIQSPTDGVLLCTLTGRAFT